MSPHRLVYPFNERFRNILQSDPKFRDFRIILRSDTDEGEAKASYQVLHTRLDLAGQGKNHFCVSLCCSWGLGNRVSFQKRMLARQTGLGVGRQAPGLARKQAKLSRKMSIHVTAQVAAMDQKSWSKKEFQAGSCSGGWVPI